jgi:ABC-2 type transport system permease protein
MQVFKLYFKLLKGEAVALSIYAFVFVGLLFMQSTYQTQNTVGFQQEKIDTAIVNYNEDSPFVQGLMKYLGEYCNFVDLGTKESDLNDALFFRQVEYILTVPYDFGEDFLAGKNPSVEKKTVPDAVYSATVDQAINNYFNTARVYMNSIPDITEEELVSYVSNDLKKEAFVKIDSKVAVGKDYSFYKF